MLTNIKPTLLQGMNELIKVTKTATQKTRRRAPGENKGFSGFLSTDQPAWLSRRARPIVSGENTAPLSDPRYDTHRSGVK